MLTRLLILMALMGLARPALPCTTFLLADGDDYVVGKSYDWDIGYGFAVFNKRGMVKQALPLGPGMKPATWTAKYASLTFNQFGREFPLSGMNEKGLVIEIMWLNASRFPKPDTRPIINELQWIQHQLDTCKNVDEMVKRAGEHTVLSVYGKVHYLACDGSGRCAAFEYLDGKLKVTPPKKLKTPTLTNNSYAESALFLSGHKGYGGKQTIPKGKGSLARFVRASALAHKLGTTPGDRVAEAFSILDSVSMGDYSKWNLVYDISAKKIHFRSRGHWQIKTVNFSHFDKSCRSPAMVLDMNQDLKGDVTDQFTPHSLAANRALVKKSLANIQSHLPKGTDESLARFPESFGCSLKNQP
ncbi:MAG: linear amide C-N hydrolase [Deltaproteobacteria bacterium]|nr:linear amide C-N hydrolase [Deltaproteobacteria bacterium]